MTITEKQFFNECLDLTIPELEAAKNSFNGGDTEGAEHIFAQFVKVALKPEVFFSIPYGKSFGGASAPGETVIEISERVLENKVISCGIPYDFGKGNKIDWSKNPTYNGYKEWEVQFHRHHEWAALGYAYLEARDEKYAEKFAELIYSWITEAKQCPLPDDNSLNYHWRTLECGIRLGRNWNTAIHAFLNSPAISDSLFVLIFMSICEQARRLYDKRTGFNWLTTERIGLVSVSVFYPFFSEAKKWYEDCIEIFVSRAEALFYPDGFEIELTTAYHGVVINDFLSLLEILGAYGIACPESLLGRIHGMFGMYPKLTNPSLHTPDLNDGNRANVVYWAKRGLEYFPEDEVLRYLATERKEGKRPEYNSVAMPYSGFFAMRTGFDADDMWALFDSGPFGAGHYHEDKLNFLLYAYRTDMLPDTGNFRYDTSLMRKYVYCTRAHNTGLVDGFSQNRLKTHKPPTLEDIYTKSDLRIRVGEKFETAEGAYSQGYGPDLLDATHKRKVVWFKKGLSGTLPFFVLIDSYSAADGEEHLYETSFQLTAAPIEVKANRLTAAYGTGATLNIFSSVCPNIYVGQYEPEYMGWRPNIEKEAREHIPAPIAAYTKLGKTATIVTLLYPAPDTACPITDLKLTEGGFDIYLGESVEHFDFTDEKFDTDEL